MFSVGVEMFFTSMVAFSALGCSALFTCPAAPATVTLTTQFSALAVYQVDVKDFTLGSFSQH